MMKKPPLYALAFGVCLGLVTLVDYLAGRAGQRVIFALAFVPLVGALCFGVLTLVAAYCCMIRQGRFVLPLLSVAALVAFWGAGRLLPRQPFLYGFRKRILSQMTPAQMREMAARAEDLKETTAFVITSPRRRLRFEEKDTSALWPGMQDSPGFSNLGDLFILHGEKGLVELEWGAGLVGHWGIRVQAPRATRRDGDAAFLLIEPDIAVFMTAN